MPRYSEEGNRRSVHQPLMGFNAYLVTLVIEYWIIIITLKPGAPYSAMNKKGTFLFLLKLERFTQVTF